MRLKEILYGSDRLKPKQEQIRQMVLYPFAGIFTALANFLSFVLMNMILHDSINVVLAGRVVDISLVIKQFVSWVATIITAYTTNRIFVFRSHGNYFLELMGFAAARLSTFVFIELLLFSFMVKWMENRLGISREALIFAVGSFKFTYIYLVKILNNIALVILNFVLSKWIVFRSSSKYQELKQKGNETNAAQ
ncbi:MAG: GtrA family protein [Saccharofermentans sp.]|nr:GtrA family protein [Saccharofermentans sp.]